MEAWSGASSYTIVKKFVVLSSCSERLPANIVVLLNSLCLLFIHLKLDSLIQFMKNRHIKKSLNNLMHSASNNITI